MQSLIGTNWRQVFLLGLLLIISVWQMVSVIYEYSATYFRPYYTEETYKNLEDTFNHSQYRQKNPTALIPDETVFSYAAGAYLHGIDPILINSEHTPLGKYLIGICIFLFRNDKISTLIFAGATVFSIYLLSRELLGRTLTALIPVLLFINEPLFINQFRYTPLLDIIQLPFIYFSLYFFLREVKTSKFWMTGVCIGLVMATKTIVPAMLLVGVCIIALLIYKKITHILPFLSSLLLSLAIFLLSYARTFMNGYTLWDFIGFQKWIFLYQKSKLLYPFSVWKLIFLNRWQTWWGDFRELAAEDWTIRWPILFTLGFVALGMLMFGKVKRDMKLTVVIGWVVAFEIFLSMGVVATRFFLPVLPALYIVSVAVFANARTHRIHEN